MSNRKSDGHPPITRSFTLSGHEHYNNEQQQQEEEKVEEHERTSSNPEAQQVVVLRSEEPVPAATRKSSLSNTSIPESNRARSKTVSTATSDVESQPIQINPQPPAPSATSTGFHFLQSIKDLTHQELYRANPLGLLGKEIISVTGTTHCPEPIPPAEDEEAAIGTVASSSSVSPNKLTPISEHEPQQLHFPLNEEEQIHMQRRRSTMGFGTGDTALPPCPAEFIDEDDDNPGPPHLFSQPIPGTMVADFIPDTMTINVFEVFIYAWGVFAFFFDMVTDLVLAHAYYQEGAYWLFLLTLMCVIIPNLTLSVFSLVWYIDGSQLKAAANGQAPFSNDGSSSYETSSSEETLNKHREEDVQQLNGTTNDARRRMVLASNSESVPLHAQRNSFCQTDDMIIGEGTVVGEDQIDAHMSRARHRPQPPEQQKRVRPTTRRRFQFSQATANVITWIIRIIILVLQLDLCLKYIRGLYYTWKGFQKRHNPKWQRFYLTKQILIDADIALLRVFDCFMDSGSQVILQLYIMLRLGSVAIKYDTLFAKQVLSIVSSLGSLAYALSGYSRCWRHMQLTHSPKGWPKGKPPPKLVSWWSTIIQWFWYLFLIMPRVLALAMFAATFRSWFWIILVAHWCGMLFWILRFRTIFCISDQTKYNPREAIFEKCYNLVCSYIFIFCYMNLRKGDTRSHYIGFYTIYYIENIAFSIIYALHSAETNTVFKYSLVTFVCVGFWFAVFFQLIYYRFLHPSDHVRASTKRNVASIIRVRPLPRFDRMKKSKSCEEMIDRGCLSGDLHNQNENNELAETVSLALTTSSLDERWHNRFSKENRQKLISQQQAIDHKVKLTRAQKQFDGTNRRSPQQPPTTLLTKLSTSLKRPATIATSLSTESSDSNSQTPVIHSSNSEHRNGRRRPFFDVPRVSLNRQQQESYAKMQPEDEDEDEDIDTSVAYITSKRTPQKYYHQQQQKMYNIDEDIQTPDDNKSSISSRNSAATAASGQEMILTAAKLTPLIKPSPPSSSSSSSSTNSRNLHHTPLPSTTAVSLC